jgi:hypothetical protein
MAPDDGSLNLTTDLTGTAVTGLLSIDCGGGGVEDMPVVGEVDVGDASDVIDGSSLMVTVVRVCEKETLQGLARPCTTAPPLEEGWSLLLLPLPLLLLLGVAAAAAPPLAF